MSKDFEARFLKARKNYIASQFSQLNGMQQEAVLTTEGPLLLLAGAGSGKTTVLINRIANIMRFGRGSDCNEIPDTVTEEDLEFLENLPDEMNEYEAWRADSLCAVGRAAPWSIMAITFTNKAANELKERLSVLLGPEAQDIWAMTFHSACCRILRRDIERMGYSRSFTIYDSSDSERIMKEIVKDMGLDDKTFPPRYVLGAISKEKDNMVSPEEMLNRAERSGDIRALHIARAYVKYQTQLQTNNALDFDDIIYITVKLLQQHEDARQYYQKKFRYVLVDEYQDTNHMQYLLTSLLAGGYENICVVGDDDQSIYRFRGATIENILNFEKQYRGSRTIRLEQNYRSTQCILNAANAVISHNLGRKGKRLWTANGQGNPILVYEANDEGAEGNFVAGQIIKQSKGKNFGEYAVLYRTNAQSNALEFAFKRNGIPYRVIGGTRFFDRAEVKDMLSYLCVINNRSDDLRLKRIINNPPRGLGSKTIDTAQRLAEAEHLPLYAIVSDPYSYAPMEKPAMKLMQFSALIEGMAQLLKDGMSLPDFYDELLIRTGYVDMLTAKDTEENKTRLENVRELKSSINAYVENAEEPTLAGFLEEIALYTDIEQYNDADALRQGPGISPCVPGGLRGRAFPRHALHRRCGGDGRGAAALLCGHYPGKEDPHHQPCPAENALRSHCGSAALPVFKGDPRGLCGEKGRLPSQAGDKFLWIRKRLCPVSRVHGRKLPETQHQAQRKLLYFFQNCGRSCAGTEQGRYGDARGLRTGPGAVRYENGRRCPAGNRL